MAADLALSRDGREQHHTEHTTLDMNNKTIHSM